MNQLKCAVIGCGRIGCGFDDLKSNKIRTHAKAYFNNKNTKLVALCDVDELKLKKYSKKYSVENTFTNVDEMFEKVELDCVSICTLSDSHLELVDLAIKSKIRGIFLEKPISNSLKNAKGIIKNCNQNQVILAVNHQRRFDPFYQKLSHFIHSEIGKIQLVNIFYGGGIANTCSHVFDILRLFFGDVKSASGVYSKNKSLSSLDPNLDVNLEFKNGINVSLHALDLTKYGICEMDIFGLKGRIKLNLITNEIKYYKINHSKFQDYKNLKKVSLPFQESKYAFDISLGLQNLIDSIRYKKEILCTGQDGYKSLEIVTASIKSAKSKRKILLPLKNLQEPTRSR